MKGRTPREIAARILQQRDRGEDFIENIAEAELAQARLSGPDRGLAVELAYGCVRREAALDWLIDRKTQGRSQKPLLRILLRLGLYQIFFLERIPEHAAVHETVQLVKWLGYPGQAGFVNAVLRSSLRERAALTQALADLGKTDPATAHSHPAWLWERWRKNFGEENARALMILNNQSPPIFARVNTLKATHDEVTAAWQQEGVDFRAQPFAWMPGGLAYEFLNHPPLTSLPSFQKGFFYIQDPSTLLAVRELGAQAGEILLDLCAAPGGKTTALAQAANNRGRIIAEDSDPARLALVRENAVRLGATAVETPAQRDPALRFDRILIDAPCSNTGVLRRRVDLRWRLQETELQRLAALQLKLLTASVPRLKPGGTIVYSTCSLEPDENTGVIKTFLAAHPGFKLVAEETLLPFRDRTDGAFTARLLGP